MFAAIKSAGAWIGAAVVAVFGLLLALFGSRWLDRRREKQRKVDNANDWLRTTERRVELEHDLAASETATRLEAERRRAAEAARAAVDDGPGSYLDSRLRGDDVDGGS